MFLWAGWIHRYSYCGYCSDDVYKYLSSMTTVLIDLTARNTEEQNKSLTAAPPYIIQTVGLDPHHHT